MCGRERTPRYAKGRARPQSVRARRGGDAFGDTLRDDVTRPDDYDEVPYEDRPVAETHPDRLHRVARAAGLPIAPPERARILELGCAHAVNLLPIAAALPGARVLGIDRSARQIERARHDVAAVGLTNLEVRCADVMDLDLGGERFDYVIVHGVLSWVPDAVRDRVLSLCATVLDAAGVAYVSYNAMPGWAVGDGVRRTLRELVGDGPATERVAEARAALAWLRGASPDPEVVEAVLLDQELAELEHRTDAYLLHEYLVPDGRAYWLREFVALAEQAGLAYVDDVARVGLDDAERQVLEDRVAARTSDPIARAQLFDVLAHRRFRASVLAHADAPRVADRRPHGRSRVPAVASIPARPCVSVLARFEAEHRGFVTTPEHACAPVDPFVACVVARLDGTRTEGDLVAALTDDLRSGRLRADAPLAAIEPALPRLIHGALERLRAEGLLLPP